MADASSSTSPPAETAEAHPYTLETLKQHNTRDDLWLLINGKVYDVTKFMDEVSLATVYAGPTGSRSGQMSREISDFERA
jgi:hypothetical protein